MSKSKNPKGLEWLLILPIAILLVSGCLNLGGGSSISGNGIVITTFEPSLRSIESNDDVLVHLEVQNQGDVIGTAAAKLIGIYPQDWGVFQTDQLLDELRPADVERGTEGQKATADWRLTAPPLKRGERRTYEPMVRVFYSYETKVTKPITFVTSDELRRIVQNGQSLNSDPAIVSAGPLTVTVRTGEFVRTKDNWQQSYFPVQIDITNTGGGLIAGENYPIGIDIEPPAGTMFKGDCPPRSQTEWGGSFYDMNLPVGLSRPISPYTIVMWNGRDATVTCELKVITPPDYRQDRDLTITLEYIYYTDQSTTIDVVGTEEWGYY
ncbi:MAG: hypothetical protein JXC85_03275 [Candidatus Aenigmarchaeota archaeon]|nr:hypothetical protein [Candidatus Aenigmarchaeota archaeon]